MTEPMKPDFSKTQFVDAVAAKIEEREQKTPRHRHIEDIGFLVAIAMTLLYGLAETARRIGLCHGDCSKDPGIPWVTLTMAFMCILPKMLGRVTAGRVWEVVGARFGGKS